MDNLSTVTPIDPAQVQITDAYTVSPTILALRIETGEVVKGEQIPYTPQAGDTINQWNILFRAGEVIGHMTADNTIVRTFDRLEGPQLDTTWADTASHYTLNANGRSITPNRVFRKSKIGGIAETGSWDFGWPMEHTVFLELPEPLDEGQTYEIDFSGNGVQDIHFTYDPTGDRSEAVHVSHIGFAPEDPAKVAFLSTWMGTAGQGLDYQVGQPFWLIDEATGNKVYEGTLELSKDGDAPEDYRGRNYNGTDVYLMDFSDFNIEGTYQVVVEGVGTSFAFDIGEQTWVDSFYISARGLYHQRSGIALGAPYTDYERPRPFHPDDGVAIYQSTATLMDTFMGLNPAVDTFEALVAGKTNQLVPEAHGGWFDAGDWDRRIQHLDVTRSMLELVELFPDYFDGVTLNIPESNNALPDVIDEALWGLDFFKRLQLPDGGVRGGVESSSHPHRFEASWQESLDIMVYAPDMWSSYKYAATAAYAAYVLQDIDPGKASEYQASAIQAMEWAEAEFANISSNTTTYTEVYDERSLAAAELFRLSGSDRWHQVFLDTTVFDDPNAPIYQWQSHNRRHAAFTYARTTQPGINPTLQTHAENALLRAADNEIAAINNTGFKWNKDPWAPTGWGSGFGVPNNQTLLRAHTLTGDEQYVESGILATQFTLGANPENVNYTTGLGYRNPEYPLISDSIAIGSDAPPGITLYGPIDFDAYDHWSLDLFRQELTPAPEQWPTAENLFDVTYLVPQAEFTVMQTIAPMAYSLGYLAALNQQVQDPSAPPEPPGDNPPPHDDAPSDDAPSDDAPSDDDPGNGDPSDDDPGNGDPSDDRPYRFRLEAEAMDLDVYQVRDHGAASEDQFISLRRTSGRAGTATATFEGEDGLYDILVGLFDENDGQSTMGLTIGDDTVEWRLDQDLDHDAVSDRNFVERQVASGIALETGDIIELAGQIHQGEYGRVDYVEFVRRGADATDPDPGNPGDDEPPATDIVTYEAEDLTLEGYQIETNAAASNHQLISLRHVAGGRGNASGEFQGPAGTYQVIAHYFDENDGQATTVFNLNGHPRTLSFDQDLLGDAAQPATLTQQVIHSAIELNPGDRFAFSSKRHQGEYARMDKLEFIPTTAAPLSQANGLTADYYRDRNLQDLAFTRTDATIDFDWGRGSPTIDLGTTDLGTTDLGTTDLASTDLAPTDLATDNFSVRWRGYLTPEHSETYRFHTASDDGVRLWVDDQLIIDNWTNHGATEDIATLALDANQPYAVVMEYYENRGLAEASLAWSSQSQPLEIIPESQLLAAATDVSSTIAV